MNCTSVLLDVLLLPVNQLQPHSCASDSRSFLSAVHCVTAFTCWSCEEKTFRHVWVGRGLGLFVWQAQNDMAPEIWSPNSISSFSPNCFTLGFAYFVWVLRRQIWSCGHDHLYHGDGVTLLSLLPLNKLYRCCINPQYPDNIGGYLSQCGLRGVLWHFVWARCSSYSEESWGLPAEFIEICAGGQLYYQVLSQKISTKKKKKDITEKWWK